jgi:hypothetical protein
MHSVIPVISFYENVITNCYYTAIKLNLLYRFTFLLFVIHNFGDKRFVYQLFVKQLLLAYLIGSFQNFGT